MVPDHRRLVKPFAIFVVAYIADKKTLVFIWYHFHSSYRSYPLGILLLASYATKFRCFFVLVDGFARRSPRGKLIPSGRNAPARDHHPNFNRYYLWTTRREFHDVFPATQKRPIYTAPKKIKQLHRCKYYNLVPAECVHFLSSCDSE